ncbi:MULTISPECIES: alpha-N-acetylglucosaminidase [unclassified Streptomyces]|uniref:alpha-N-acetylglucosaminidase n=1 Tax=unclassified Streptomyces TaxID=2593676 RepID=UPI00202F3BF5|nr:MULTISPECIES: alpha-N-acetylglucosaminidase [unclassified Streptomyces]MCM1968242.1 alpha-N-acetylglucosaminidase [Streptomyces sp. G1]MCX5301281.1 alpha-N-acetylglucosaminidase [Streptomyces sp. NBC_00193]
MPVPLPHRARAARRVRRRVTLAALPAALLTLAVAGAAPGATAPAAGATAPAAQSPTRSPAPAPAPSPARAGAGHGAAAPPARPRVFDSAPARASLQRLLPRHAGQFTLVPDAAAGPDTFTVSGTAGAITVRGSTGATLLTGVGWYLQHVAGADIGWPGDSIGLLPAELPAVPSPVTRSAQVAHRYALNDTDDGYSGPYRTFEEHQRQIDLLALHGINEVFVQVGAEYPYYRALQQFGYSAEELREWIPGPGHQSWWLLQNLSGFGGPVSEELMRGRAELGGRIAEQLRGLGMTPVLPGYFGTVPPAFAGRNPGAVTVPQGDWAGFERPDWLDPVSPPFARLAAAYYAEQRAVFGDSTMYRMSPLHEGGQTGSVDVKTAAGAVQQALWAAHPGALWAVLGWQDDPTKELLAGVDTSKLLILDGLSDRYNRLDRETRWGGTSYAIGSIYNFGGHTTIGANTSVWIDRYQSWRAKPDSALTGIAYLPEATGTNPAAFDLFTDLAWEPGPVDQQKWFADFASRRYGAPDAKAAAAWEELRKGPYSTSSGLWSESQDSLFSARPSLTAVGSAYWSPKAMRYQAGSVRRALDHLLGVDPRLRGSSAYRFDLVDTARQALANHSRVLLPQIKAAYDARDLALFRRLTADWAHREKQLDALVGSDPNFLLGSWLSAARAHGADAAEQDRYEYDARSILSVWGRQSTSEGGFLHDYANREWSGLISELYARRWSSYFASLEDALVRRAAPRAIDWHAFEEDWAKLTTRHPARPSGDPYTLASGIAATLPEVN